MKQKMSFEEINTLAEKLATFVKAGDVIALDGDLGTGKTSFVKAFGKALGISSTIKSPTFNYVLEYLEGRLPLFHFDVYRLNASEEVYDLGFEEFLTRNGVTIIEWAKLIQEELPETYLQINLKYLDDEVRELALDVIGDSQRKEELFDYVDFSN